MLLGRELECRAVDQAIEAARKGRGGALVLRGDAGVGKTALLAHARERAAGMTVLNAAGIESDGELPYAALHQLLRPLLARVSVLPPRQADAVSSAFGLASGRLSDRFLVGVGVLGLLSDAAAEQPLLCVVDDGHWLDRESGDALLFAARRLEVDAVAILFAARAGSNFGADLATLSIGPLDDSSARALLGERQHRLDDAARERIVAAAAGNPLALIELAERSADMTTQPWPTFTSIERTYLDVIRALPSSTQLLLLVAAAAESEDFGWIARAAAALGADGSHLAPAERAALVAVDAGGLRFRHPLVRSAVYNGAAFDERRRVHEALAVTLREDDPDRQAWHRSAAATGPDEGVAAELEAAAARAHRRGGQAAASAALERAAKLSTDEQARLRRLIAAAEKAWQAGNAPRAERLVEQARNPQDPLLRSDHARLRGLISAQAGRPRDAAATLAEAAVALAPTVPARSIGLAALAAEAAWFGGDGARLAELAELARSFASDEFESSRFPRLYIDGLAATFDSNFPAATEPLSVASALAGTLDDARMISWGGDCADLLGDAIRAYELHAKGVARARAVPAIGDLVHGLYVLARTELSLGRLADATADASQGLQLACEMDEPGSAAHLTALIARVAALRGDANACRALAAEALEQAVPSGLALAMSEATLALAELELVLSDPGDALARLEPLTMPTAHPAYRIKAVPLLVEAAARAGVPQRARPALAAATAWAEHSGGPTLIPQLARCRALLDAPTSAEETFSEALRLHDACPVALDRARTQLAYGEHLRRLKRKTDARIQLRAAFETFEALGAGLWAERAAVELRATGETARRRDASTVAELTPQEQQIARLVATGASNREVAAQLFLSPKTVEYHLRKVFQKLGVGSRTDLIRLHLDEDTAAPAAIAGTRE